MTRLDRRGPNRGDASRDALLTVLDEMLRDGTSLADIKIGQVAERAGVSRSAFYFYFENKAMAVFALVRGMYEEVAVATDHLLDVSEPAPGRIRTVISRLFDSVDQLPHTYRALLEARATSATVRDDWDRGRVGFAEEVAAMIVAERASGAAPGGADAAALAGVLLELNDRAIERYALGGGPARELHIDALTSVWVRSIYGGN
ncbi:TetR/AcrR family transcriptional regulator [Tomitella fengzijianii]|uniref:TetR/AcrR family transcriptional regulator n=1 Tax=Tomitella fengzijianii TaxID=2597660 RepID=A0A516X6L5_9ACTN|nr:TetR/AcrR family transcriptional regulator [Tomitella fengzijianii]QDQ98301.1 TetR/AcrR family transcriptional regulator [Tomitella fengzijianii]